MTKPEFDYLRYFPHSEIRPVQKEAIEFILDAFVNKKKRFVICEAGTGVGKSAVGVTVARYLLESRKYEEQAAYKEGAYFLTTQKILQDQYVKDFSGTNGCMKSIKSSSNYKCHFHKMNTCSQSQALLRNEQKGTSFFKACTFNCTYKNAKESFLNSGESVTNFPYALTEANFSGKIRPRDLLIVDEAHNVESQLGKFIEVTISERFAKHTLSLPWPDVNTALQAHRWICEVYYPKVKSHLDHVDSMMDQFKGLNTKIKEFSSLSKQYDLLRGHVTKIKTFLKVFDKDNWVFEKVEAFGRSMRKFQFKPVDVSPFANDYLFRLGKNILMMSATILDQETFCETLGIDMGEVEFISIPSPFQVENRPVYYFPVGRMSASEIEKTLPNLKSAVEEILKQHKGEKGIIHCHTFKIARFLKFNIKGRLGSRLLIHNSDDREEVLNEHTKSKKDTVLLSPSMSEGVDLKNDLSRFQIIAKIPYPYLGDKQTRKRMKKWKMWYAVQTAKLIMQSAGRSVRNSEDHAVTYILDEDWFTFYQRNSQIFPEDFKSTLKN